MSNDRSIKVLREVKKGYWPIAVGLDVDKLSDYELSQLVLASFKSDGSASSMAPGNLALEGSNRAKGLIAIVLARRLLGLGTGTNT